MDAPLRVAFMFVPDAATYAAVSPAHVRPRLYLLPSFSQAPHGLVSVAFSDGVRRKKFASAMQASPLRRRVIFAATKD